MTDSQPQSPDKKHILVVEDDPFYLRIFEKKLTVEGFDVQLASDGEQGLRAAENRKPDLILLDMIMPVKDGFETLKELKQSATLKTIPVIVLSNLGQESDIQKTKELDAVDFIIKSNMSIQEVIEKVKKYV